VGRQPQRLATRRRPRRIEPDRRNFLVRLFQADSDNFGVARAVLSDSYKVIDNMDALMATLDGIREAGTDIEFDGLDLSERRLHARVVAPADPFDQVGRPPSR
jgi:hypothetical protein